jgi:hypothetical protein
MPKIDNLEPLLAAPAEALDVEFKGWLDLRDNDEHKGLLAKAAIALANEGGGVIVIGYREDRPALTSEPRPPEIAGYDADLINNIVRRFASPAFHCALKGLPDPQTGHQHAVVEVPGPGGFGFPVMSKSGTPANTIRPHLCYMRKPAPESAPPENQADWERLLTWRVAECLDHARILGSLLAPGQELKVLFRARWHGLAGRQLSSLDPMQAFYVRVGRTSRQNEFAVGVTVDVAQIADNLPEIIHPLLAPLYELFDFFELTMDHVRQTLGNRRS